MGLRPATPQDVEAALLLSPIFYRAALDFDLWPDVLRQLGDVFDAQIVQLTVGNIERGEFITQANYGITPEMLTAWFAIPDILEADPRRSYIRDMPNRPFFERQVMPEAMWRNSRIFRELYEPFGLDGTLTAHALVDEEQGISAMLGLIRSEQNGLFEEADVARLHLYLPHFREAMRCATRLWRSQARQQELTEILNHLRIEVLIVDRFGYLRFANSAARRLLDSRDGLSLTANRIAAESPGDGERLLAGIFETAISGHVGAAPRSIIRVRRRGRPTDLIVTISRIGNVNLGQAASLAAPEAVLFVLDPSRRYEGDAEVLQRIFGLTQIESDVICRIARGEAPRAIAATTGRSYETIRTHLKSIYGKTGVRSQSELVQLVVAVAEP